MTKENKNKMFVVCLYFGHVYLTCAVISHIHIKIAINKTDRRTATIGSNKLVSAFVTRQYKAILFLRSLRQTAQQFSISMIIIVCSFSDQKPPETRRHFFTHTSIERDGFRSTIQKLKFIAFDPPFSLLCFLLMIYLFLTSFPHICHCTFDKGCASLFIICFPCLVPLLQIFPFVIHRKKHS